MKKLILFFSFLFLITETFSQTLSDSASKDKVNESLHLKPRIYKTNILIYDKSEFIKGYLDNLSDSGLELSSSPVFLSLEKKNNALSAYNYDQLRQVTIRRKGSTGRGVSYGALIGVGVGAVAGLALGNDPSGWLAYTAEEKALEGSIIALPVGALIGAIIGAVAHKTFMVGGGKNEYKAMRESIMNDSGINNLLKDYQFNL